MDFKKERHLPKALFSFLFTLALISSCAKDLPKKEIYNPDKTITDRFSAYDADAEYLYVPMTMGTPREVKAADPFYQGQEKIVKMKFTEDGIEVYEPEKDGRFTDNDLNNSPVMTIPGTYLDYKCRENNLGECTQDQEENQDISWQQKRFFVPKLEDLTVNEVNPLDVQTLTSEGCLTKIRTEAVGHTIEKGVLNIELEKTYKTNDSWECIREHYFADTDNFSGFSQASFKVRFFYSMVKLDTVASKDYQAVNYPIPDHDEFGFFKNKVSKLNNDFDSHRKNETFLLNRWNPNKKFIEYHLSDTFNKPRNKLIKDATYKAVKGMNKSLEMANAGIQIKLIEPSGKKSGDLRQSMIVLIDDPLSNGLLGYAPTVTNPRTGEIVQGHINMYSGVLTSAVRRTWSGMVDFTVKQKEYKAIKPKSNDKADKNQEDALDEKLASKDSKLPKNFSPSGKFKSILDLKPVQKLERLSSHDTLKATYAIKNRLKNKFVWTAEHDENFSNLSEFDQKIEKENQRLARYAENNALSIEAFTIGQTVKKLIPGIEGISGVFNSDGTLKTWDKLDAKQKEKATNIIVPYTYTATLVHEMGHGLGLRHNFAASKDAANYWSEEEAKALGLSHAPAYSSVMDYAFDPLNEGTIFGKYDIAALRFGYAREVEVLRELDESQASTKDYQKSEFIKIEDSLSTLDKQIAAINQSRQDEQKPGGKYLKIASRVPYQFCTDSNAGLSVSCNRFDEGSTLVEIVKHYIDNYETNYQYRNFRNGRNTFQAEGLGRYAEARYHEFNRIRGIFEEWEFFTTIYDVDTMAKGCSDEAAKKYPGCKRVNDIRDATKLAANFFLKVLKTPDHLCALADPSAPNRAIKMEKLAEVYKEIKYSVNHLTTSCFDPAVKKYFAEQDQKYLVVGEAGKFLNGIKDTNPLYIYSNDREVRGTWVDKVMAMKALVQRKSGRPITETTHMSFAEHPDVAVEISSYLEHLVLGEPIEEPVLFTTENGQKFKMNYFIDLSYEIDGPQDSLGWLKRFLGLPKSGSSKLTEVLLSNAKKWTLTDDETFGKTSYALANLFSVYKFRLGDPRELSDLKDILLDDAIYASSEQNVLPHIMIETLRTFDNLSQIGRETVLKVGKKRVSFKLPEDYTEEQIEAAKLSVKELKELRNAAKVNTELTLEIFISFYKSKEKGTAFFNAYKLGEKALTEIIDLRVAQDVPPEDFSDVEKSLYEYDIETLIDFINNKMQKKAESYVQKLPYLPQVSHYK